LSKAPSQTDRFDQVATKRLEQALTGPFDALLPGRRPLTITPD